MVGLRLSGFAIANKGQGTKDSPSPDTISLKNITGTKYVCQHVFLF